MASMAVITSRKIGSIDAEWSSEISKVILSVINAVSLVILPWTSTPESPHYNS